MKRDFSRLGDDPYDLLVIGGGIYGSWTAFHGARRGLRVALVDRGDWASGTSSVSSKLIHGGLRYLEHGRIGLVRKSLQERAFLSDMAPHMVRPTRFIVPFYDGGRTNPLLVRAGLTLYDLISRGDRPGGRRIRLNTNGALSSYPFLREEGLRGALSYGDAVTDDARLCLEVVEAASDAGAAVVNYAEALEPLMKGGGAGGAVVRDRLDGTIVEVEAAAVVNTAGPWVTGMKGCRELAGEVRLSKGVHLVFPPLPVDEAFLFLTRQDSRVLFLIPWYGKTLVGTTDTDYDGSPDDVRVEEEDRAYIFEELRHVMKGGIWDESSVLGSFAGLRALADEPGKPSHALTREWVLREPRKGLLVSIGGKYTSARVDAGRIVDRVMKRAGRSGPPATATLPWKRRPNSPFDRWLAAKSATGTGLGLAAETAYWLCRRYGTVVEEIHDLLRGDPSLAEPILKGLPFCRGEIVFAVRNEMALGLTDILRRRIPLMLLSPPDLTVLTAVSELAGRLLGWSRERRQAEEAHGRDVWGGTPERAKGLL